MEGIILKSLLYLIDDLNYMGGGNIATYNQIDYLHKHQKFHISIFSQTTPSEVLKNRFSGIVFHKITAHGKDLNNELFFIGFKDIVRSKQYTAVQKVKKALMTFCSRIIGKEKTFELFIADNTFKKNLNSIISEHDIACIPFENSRFRFILANADCKRKVQCIHTDYAHWSSLSFATRDITKNDGLIYEKFDKIVFVSNKSLSGFIDKHPALADKCVVCGNIFDLELINHLSTSPLDSNNHYFREDNPALKIITVARLADSEKALKRSLDVAKMLKDAGYLYEWLFVGDGYDREMLHNYADSLGLNGYVLWAGHQDNPYKFVKGADVFALFSYYEGIPNTIYEALILGIPVIAVNIGGIPEQITPGIGWLVESDSQDIFRGLSLLSDNRTLVETAKQKLRSYSYDNDRIGKEMELIFDNDG